MMWQAFGLMLCASAALTAVGVAGQPTCSYTLVESIPQHFALNTSASPSIATHDAWLDLINGATDTLDIASFYWTLTGGDPTLGGEWGQKVFDALKAALARGVVMRIAQSEPSDESPDTETEILASYGASVRTLNFTRWLGAGILHTKFMVADGANMYVGSANMDWRSLTQVKEMGILLKDCEKPMGADLELLFDVYWYIAPLPTLPPINQYPVNLWTAINASNPAPFCAVPIADPNAQPDCNTAFFASSPPEICTVGRTGDIDALVGAIAAAQTSIDIEIMDYAPAFLYASKPTYWAVLDTAIRTAVFDRNVSVRFLGARWNHTIAGEGDFYASLQSMCDATSPARTCAGSIEIKWFSIPDDPSGVSPYTRVNHAKYLVSDSTLFIDTSNWSADYFVSTGGVSGNFHHPSLIAAGTALFERDWNSPFATPINM